MASCGYEANREATGGTTTCLFSLDSLAPGSVSASRTRTRTLPVGSEGKPNFPASGSPDSLFSIFEFRCWSFVLRELSLVPGFRFSAFAFRFSSFILRKLAVVSHFRASLSEWPIGACRFSISDFRVSVSGFRFSSFVLVKLDLVSGFPVWGFQS